MKIQPPKKRSWISVVLRITVSLVAILLIVKWSGVNWSLVPKLLHQAHWEWIALGVGCFLVARIVAGIRWYQLAKPVGFNGSVYDFIKLKQVGLFFGAFLPTTVGGDIMSCHYLKKLNPHQSFLKGFMTTMMDRYLALFWLMVIGGGLLSLNILGVLQPPLHLPPMVLWLSIVFVVVFVVVVLVLDRVFHHVFQKKFAEKFSAYSEMRCYLKDKALMLRMSAMAVMMHLTLGACHYAFAKGVGIAHVPFWYFVFLYAFVSICINLIPSVNGVGIREGGYVLMLAKVGVAREIGFLFALLWLATLMLFSLQGGLYYLLFEHEKPRLTPQPTETAP